jgi:hypothetical protein
MHKIESLPMWNDLESKSSEFIMKFPSQILASESAFDGLNMNEVTQVCLQDFQ